MDESWCTWIKTELCFQDDIFSVTGKGKIPQTKGFFLLPFAYSMIIPTIQQITTTYALYHLAQTSTNYMKSVFHDLISIPVNFFVKKNKTFSNVNIDSVIESHMKKGIEIQKDMLGQITESKHTMMLLFVSILSLYFQYLGMTIMKSENAKYQGITAYIDDADMEKPAKGGTVNSGVKRMVHSKYNTSTYYSTPEEGVIHPNLFNIKQYDPVRIIYNTLVGLNHTLFLCMGGQSDDPTHEIVHWTKALLYWEIITRLLNLHGLRPLKVASKLFLQDLWNQHSQKSR